MIFRNLDQNGDWTFGKGLSNYASQNQAIGLNIKTRLQSWVGDCFFDLKAGIDWVNRLGSKGQRELLEVDLRRVVLQSQDVTGLVAFDTLLNVRSFRADFSVNTVFSKEYVDSLTVET